MRVFLLSLISLLLISSYAVPDDKAIEAIEQITDKLIQQVGLKKEDVEISRVDTRDAQVAEAYIYELDVELEGNIVPIRFAEDVTSWRYIQPLPEAGELPAELPKVPVLSPFQLVGPVELWIQDGKDVRLAVPHDVDAGALNRVILADGATVTITGARELSLARPFKVPLPLGDEESGDSVLSLSEQLRDAAKEYDKPLISLRVVGPSSLTASPAPETQLERQLLKVKRLSPGAVEITKRQEESPSIQEERLEESPSIQEETPSRSPGLWPLASLNSSDAKLVNIERVLRLFLGPKASESGSFSILRAKASAVRFYRIEFELVTKLDQNLTSFLPEWSTKPSVERQQFELLAKVDGDKITPIRLKPLKVYESVTTTAFAWDDPTANVTRGAVGASFSPPISHLTLNV